MNDFTDHNYEAQRTSEVDEILERNNISREEVAEKFYTCPMVLCDNYEKNIPASGVMLANGKAFCRLSNDEMIEVKAGSDAEATMSATPTPFSTVATGKQMAHIQFLGDTKKIDVQLECRKHLQCEIDELTEPDAEVLIQHLQNMPVNGDNKSEADRRRSATAEAEVNTAVAGQAVATDLVPRFGEVLAQAEPTAIAYGFPPAVQALITKTKLTPEQTGHLLTEFRGLFDKVSEWQAEVNSITITGREDKASIDRAKELYKTLQSDRLNVKKRKDLLKEPYLRPGQLIDGIFRVYIEQTAPIEAAALEKAKYVENLERAEKEQVRADREAKLAPYVENVKAFNLHPDVMTDEAFDTLFSQSQELHAARAAQKAREDEERQRREDEAAAERVRIRRQNDRVRDLSVLGFTRDEESKRYKLDDLTVYDVDLLNEADSAWRSRLDALKPKAEAIRVETERLRREGEQAREAQLEKERLERDEEFRRQREAEAALLAPDKIKLERLAASIESIEIFDTANEKVADILGTVRGDLTAVVVKLRSQIKQLP